MASDTVHTTEFNLNHLTVKSVTLGLNRGTIVREMNDVPIHKGPNMITIYGLDSYVDQDSIRVTGRGRATITDIQTEIVPQREQFENVFLEYDNEDSSSIIGEEDPDDNFGVDKSELIKAETELKKLKNQFEEAENEQNSAQKSLEFLEGYGRTMKSSDSEVSKVEQYLKVYAEENAALFKLYKGSEERKEALKPEIDKLTRKVDRLAAEFTAARRAAAKPARQARDKKLQARDVKVQEKRRLQAEKRRFWRDDVVQVVLHLDGSSASSPSSSRRSSVATAPKQAPEPAVQTSDNTISFSLSYVTPDANWSPRYELELKTPTSSGKIVYCAEYYNRSSETWEHTNVTLSTSQTSFSGLEETHPVLQPWNVKLHKDERTMSQPKTTAYWNDGLENKAEVRARRVEKGWNSSKIPPPPQQMMWYNGEPQMPQQAQQLDTQRVRQVQELERLERVAQPRRRDRSYSDSSNSTEDNDLHLDMEATTLSDDAQTLGFEESTREEYGLTTTYNIPGQRTIRPSSLKRRHVIAELDFTSVTFSHVVVPKLRAAAFLKARVRNTSSVSLLRGRAGLTLDGTFLGTTRIPSCTAGSFFSLSLGVDPGIQIAYAKPTVRRITSGFFAKEDCATFTRTCRIQNTKSTSISIHVHDQVPVSEDEGLKVNILEPKGLDKDGDTVKVRQTSEPGVGAADTKWGKGVVRRGKGGIITWDLTVEGGKGVKLLLEYGARIPSGQKIVGLD